jgi:hypothetical protein
VKIVAEGGINIFEGIQQVVVEVTLILSEEVVTFDIVEILSLEGSLQGCRVILKAGRGQPEHPIVDR